MSEEEKKEEMHKLFQEIYKIIAKELLIDLDEDSLDEEEYDDDNEDHQKYFRFFEWIRLLTIIVRQQKIGVLRLILGYFKRKELRPKLRHVLEFLIHKVSEEEIALFNKVGIILSERQKKILEDLARATHSKKHHIDRAKIILLCSEQLNNSKISRELDIHRVTVRKWRYRWLLAMPSLSETEEKEPLKLKRKIHSVLEDAYRSGTPATFQPEQIATIIATAIRSPAKFDKNHLSYWTLHELKNYLEEEAIVQKISISSLSRILNQFDIKPHRMEYYLNPEIEDEEEFKKQVKYLCMLYQTAKTLSYYGIEVICLDEMTGIQALEHNFPVRPIEPGQPMKVETKYQRHGTTGILGARSVVSGLITALIQKERKEKDFVNLVKHILKAVPATKYIFIVDNLNTHMSESLVKLVAEHEKIDIESLGKKEVSGILKNMESRKEFLSSPARKKIQFFYMPKNCSWLNQIETWFSIIKRRILTRRSSYKSVKELEERIEQFIEYYNKHLAKPFKWEYGGHFKVSVQ